MESESTWATPINGYKTLRPRDSLEDQATLMPLMESSKIGGLRIFRHAFDGRKNDSDQVPDRASNLWIDDVRMEEIPQQRDDLA